MAVEFDPHNQSEILLSESDHAIRVVAQPSQFKVTELADKPFVIGTLPGEFVGDVEASVYLIRRAETYTTFATVEMPPRDDLSALEQFAQLTDQLEHTNRASVLDKYRAFRPITKNLLMVYMLELQPDGSSSREVLIYPCQLSSLNNGLGADYFRRTGNSDEADSLITEVGRSVSDVVNILNPDTPNPNRSLRITLPRDAPEEITKELVVKDKPITETTRRPRTIENSNLPTFSDFGGLDVEMMTLMDFVASLDNPLLAEHGLARPGAILLEGPGGVGKTALVQALSREINAKYIPVRVSDIAGQFVGEPVKKLRDTFSKAATASKNNKVVLFFDEFDGLFSSDSMGNQGVVSALVAELKIILNNCASDYPNLIVVAASNNVGNISQELLRPGRFDTVIKIPAPSQNARQAIFANMLLRHEDHFKVISDEDVDVEFARLQDGANGVFEIQQDSSLINIHELATITEDLTGADIKNIVDGLLRSRLQLQFKTGSSPTSTITHAELVKAIQAYRTSRPSNN